MSYNTNILLTDLKGLPIPQYYNPVTDKLEALIGSNGASRVMLYDQNGNPLLTTANPGVITLAGSNSSPVNLLSNATAAGSGTPQSVGGYKTLRVKVWGTGTFDLQIQGIMANTDGLPSTIDVTQLKGITVVTDITTAGFYDIDCTGYDQIQASVISVSGGNVNAAGRWVA